jgi:WD40 repeat protein
MTLEGEHCDLIKKVQLSPDGTVLISAGSDCTAKVWDLGTRRCVQTLGTEQSNP